MPLRRRGISPFTAVRYQNIGDDIIVQRTLSGCIGKGDLNHNNRSIITANVDKDRIADDIIICQRSLKDLYHELFDEALEEFNARQTRRDRKIANYQEHIRHSRQEKEFYEVLFQVGNRDDTGVDSDMCIEAAAVLEEYARSFEVRNPHLKLFNAVIHLDESTPHLHLDFVPVTDEKRKNGMRVRNSLTGALRQQGCTGKGIGRTITIDWLEQEKAYIGKLMLERGIEWVKLEETKEGLPLKDYKLKMRQEEIDAADKLIDMKLTELHKVEDKLGETEDKVKSAETELTEKKQEIADSEEKLSSVTAETEKADAELTQKIAQVNKALTYLPDFHKNEKAEHEYLVAVSELHDLLKSGFSIMKNKDTILSWIDTLESLVNAALDKQDRADLSVAALRERGNEFLAERDQAREEVTQLKKEKSAISSERQSLQTEVKQLRELLSMIERIAPSTVERGRQLVQEQKEQRQREQQRQAEKQSTRKRNSWGLE